MKSRISVPGLSAILLLTLSVLPFFILRAGAQDRNASPCVLVELFTSEGCSSCPSADSVLAQLQKEQRLKGIHVITLGEHVAYWNYLGWRDPYSAESFSERQHRYASVFRSKTVYTPQLIIDGHVETAATSYEKILKDVKTAETQPKAELDVKLVKSGNKAVTVKCAIHVPDKLVVQDAAIYVAVVEDNLVSVISRGENSGRTLAHSSVVRDLHQIGSFRENSSGIEATVNIAPSWKRKDVRIVVFMQTGGDLQVRGAGESKLSDAVETAG